jgi:hypothetical protein
MSLICIIDRNYNIVNDKEIQRRLAELIYLPHIYNVFVDTDATTENKGVLGANNNSSSSNTRMDIYKRYIYPNVINNKQREFNAYLNSDELKETIKVYIAPNKIEMNILLKNTTGTEGFDHKNTVYILCHQPSLMNLIMVLQTMEFKAGPYISQVTTDSIHPILTQILTQRHDINIKVTEFNGGSGEGRAENTQQLLAPKSEIEPAPPLVGINRVPNTHEAPEPTVLGHESRTTNRHRTNATKKQSLLKSIEKSIVRITGKNAGNTKIKGNRLGESSTLFDAPAYDTIYFVAPDESDMNSSSIFTSLVKFFTVKPDTRVKIRDIGKTAAELPKKLIPKKLSGDADNQANTAIIKIGAEKAKKALPNAKVDVKKINKLLDTVKSEFEKAKKEFLKDPENMRIYREYILPHVKPGKGLILDELLDKLETKMLTSEESKAILQDGLLVANSGTNTNGDNNLHDKIKKIINKYKYICESNPGNASFTSLICHYVDKNTKITLEENNNPNTDFLKTLVSGSKKMYDFALLLNYINMHNYYNSRVLYCMDLLSQHQYVTKQLQNVKTMKIRPSENILMQRGRIIPANNIPTTKQTIKAHANQVLGPKIKIDANVKERPVQAQEIKRESRKIKHAWKYLFNKDYRAARGKSKEDKKTHEKKQLAQKLANK